MALSETVNSKIPWKNKLIPIAIVGDLILDEYLEGSVIKISPEAPVAVHHVEEQNYRAGGAANTALNIGFVGGLPLLFGIWGDDEGAGHLRKVLQDARVNEKFILADSSRPTTRKCRVYSENQQLLRIDWERVKPLHREFCQKILSSLAKEDFKAILLSDYGKGTLTPELVEGLIQLAKQRRVPSVIDPKGLDYSHYRGATLITPNYKEACLAVGVDTAAGIEGEVLGRKLIEKYGFEHVLVTMGAKGMVLVSRDNDKIVHKTARAREVFDVTGAGDTVASLMALGLGAAGSFEQVMELANIAAGVVVEKKGVHPIHLEELETAMRRAKQDESEDNGDFTSVSTDKIKNIDSLQLVLAKARKKNRKVVFTNGCFDILHAGHVSYLAQARQAGDLLVIGVNDDASVKRQKGPERPVNKVEDRMTVLASLAAVDYLIPFSEDTPLRLIEAIRPDVLAKGADWEIEKIVGAKEVQSWGGQVLRIPFLDGRSTTKIIEKIKK